MSRKDQVTIGGNPVTLLGEAIRVGAVAPDFTVVDSDLNPVTLSSQKGKTVIISISHSIDTSVCEAQMRRFNLEAEKLENVVIYAISVDLPFALKRFCAAEGIESIFTLSDYKDLDFGTKYGFVIEELRLLARGIVVVDPNGIVKYVEYVPEVSNLPDFDKALAAVNA